MKKENEKEGGVIESQTSSAPLSIYYTDSGPLDSVQYTLRFLAKIGGGEERLILMDTGSTGIVVPCSAIANYSTCEKVYPQLPAPHYSSSGAHYDGEWIYTSFELRDHQGNHIKIEKIPVFAVKEKIGEDVSQVSMMGVGIHSKVYGETYNPFLNLPQMLQRDYSQAYIITRSHVSFGFSEAVRESFNHFSFPLNCETAMATTTLLPPKGGQFPAFKQTTPLLIDTGIAYMIVTPKKKAAQPSHDFVDAKTQHLIDGTQVKVTLTDNKKTPFHYTFTVSNKLEAVDPRYVRFAIPSTHGFINTGRHILTEYDYLVDFEQYLIGLKPVA